MLPQPIRYARECEGDHPAVWNGYRSYACGSGFGIGFASVPKQIYYNAAEHIAVDTAADPYLRPAFSFHDRLRRLNWNICWSLLYRTSPRPLHSWRSFLLRLFGATLGPNCHFYPRSKVWAPWNLLCADQVTAGRGAGIYNPAPVPVGLRASLSPDA